MSGASYEVLFALKFKCFLRYFAPHSAKSTQSTAQTTPSASFGAAKPDAP
jgi:hypothetical protein